MVYNTRTFKYTDEANITLAEQICDPVLLPPLSLPLVFGVMFQEQPPRTHKTLTTRFYFILFLMDKLMQVPELKRSYLQVAAINSSCRNKTTFQPKGQKQPASSKGILSVTDFFILSIKQRNLSNPLAKKGFQESDMNYERNSIMPTVL